MNRQIRRNEAKKERLQEEKKQKEREARRAKRRAKQQRRKAGARAKSAGADEGKGRGKDASKNEKEGDGTRAPAGKRAPGRFSGALTFATVFFIALQGVTPTDGSLVNQVVSASFYLLFGYFAVLWMMRRGTENAVPFAFLGGIVLAVATAVTRWLQPDLALEPWTVGLTPPLLLAGTLLGRLVYEKAPA